MDFAAVNRQIGELERRIGEPAELSPGEQLFVGVDLGTAYIVVVVVNAERKPVACALEFAQVVRDGLVVDYTGATRIVRKLVQQLGERLGRELELAAIAVPPGTGERECCHPTAMWWKACGSHGHFRAWMSYCRQRRAGGGKRRHRGYRRRHHGALRA